MLCMPGSSGRQACRVREPHRRRVDVQQAVRDAQVQVGVAGVRDVLHQVRQQRQQALRVAPACRSDRALISGAKGARAARARSLSAAPTPPPAGFAALMC